MTIHKVRHSTSASFAATPARSTTPRSVAEEAPPKAWVAGAPKRRTKTDFVDTAMKVSPEAGERAGKLRDLLTSLRGKSEREQIDGVNEWVNDAITYTHDDVLYGVADHWATPLETLQRGQGDCEDSAILKYFALKQLGVPDERLELNAVIARFGGPHMVLSVQPSDQSEALVLDIAASVFGWSVRTDLTRQRAYSKNTPTGDEHQASLTKWHDVLARARASGLAL